MVLNRLSRRFLHAGRISLLPQQVNLESVAATTSREPTQREHKKIEKILVKVHLKDNTSRDLLMNKNISTPFNCAKHLSNYLADSSALCVIHGMDERVCSMHTPIDEECELRFISFHSEEYADEVNQAYWRSCGLLLGASLSETFNGPIQPIGRVHNSYKDGFFAYELRSEFLKGWQPIQSDLSSIALSLTSDVAARCLPFEVEEDDRLGTICRVGGYSEGIDGPPISHTGQIGRFSIVKANASRGVWRFSGVSLPSALPPSSYQWSLIVDNAIKKSST